MSLYWRVNENEDFKNIDINETTITYIDDKITEQHEYTNQEVEALRTEGYIQEALTQLAAWATSDEGKRFRKKLWTRISSKCWGLLKSLICS